MNQPFYHSSVNYPEKGAIKCNEGANPMGIPAEVKQSFKMNYTYSVTWEVNQSLSVSLCLVPYWFTFGLSVRPSVIPLAVFRTFLCSGWRYSIEIWYMTSSQWVTDQVWVSLRLTNFWCSHIVFQTFFFFLTWMKWGILDFLYGILLNSYRWSLSFSTFDPFF
jgi:hypothetical protein